MAERHSSSKTPLRAAAYIRMSSGRQEASPDQQRGEVKKLAKPHNCKLIREYFDEAVSGDQTDKRTAFLAMHKAACAGEFDVILCWDQDRFGRFDSIEAGFWIKPLRDAGIRLITLAQGPIDWDDFAGRMIYSIQQEGKNAFLRDLSRNVLRGKLAASMRGEWTGGPPPLGYQIVDKRLVRDPATAPILQRIFEDYAGGMSLRDVADALNREEIPSPRRKGWRAKLIRRYITDSVYVGTWVWPKNPDGRYSHATADGVQPGPSTRKGRHHRPGENPIVIKNNHEALVTEDLFDRCRVKLIRNKSNRSPYRAKRNPFLLTGLLKCAHCGASMVGVRRTYRNPAWTTRSYLCLGYQQKGTAVCQRHYVREEPIVDLLIRKLQEEWLAPARLKQLRREIRWQLKPKRQTGQEDGTQLRSQIASLERKIDQGTERLLTAPSDLTDMLAGKLRQWQAERTGFQARLGALQQPRNTTAAEMDKLVDQAIKEPEMLRERLHEVDRALLREVLREMVSKVDLWFERRKLQTTTRSFLKRGLIHLRPELQSIKLVPGVSRYVPTR